MNTQIAFTPAELIQLILGICGAIVSISAAITIIIRVIQKAKEPEHNQDERISALEKKMDKVERLLDNDNKRLKSQEEAIKILMRSNLAMMRHLIDGNHTEDLEKAMEEVHDYLLAR